MNDYIDKKIIAQASRVRNNPRLRADLAACDAASRIWFWSAVLLFGVAILIIIL